MRLRFRVAMAIAAISLVWASALVPTGAAHVNPPTLTALHAFVGDPLWGLDTPQGSLVAVLPDEQTAQASTTKIMTLHLASIALSDGVVHLDDQVTIDALVASIGGSSMQDVNGVALEEGEVVGFGDLIRGMMYPSGNNAAWAIAEHVARAYFGASAGVPEFVDLMNQHAADEGLVDTHFANPNGFDDPNHYTTARELAKLMNHAITDPFFQQVVGFIGTWNATTQAPGGGTKTYAFSFPFFTPFPGYEGAKGGGTPNCNGPNNGCMVMSGRRLGRRVVLGFMQGQPWAEETGLFNYAFATIFHPDPSGQSAPLPSALAQEDLDCLSSSRAVSAVVEPGGPAKLVVWSTDVGGAAITKLAEGVLPGSGKGSPAPKAVAVAHLPSGDVIMAYRKGAQVELSRWSIAPNGTPALLSDGIKAGPASAMGLPGRSTPRRGRSRRSGHGSSPEATAARSLRWQWSRPPTSSSHRSTTRGASARAVSRTYASSASIPRAHPSTPALRDRPSRRKTCGSPHSGRQASCSPPAAVPATSASRCGRLAGRRTTSSTISRSSITRRMWVRRRSTSAGCRRSTPRATT